MSDEELERSKRFRMLQLRNQGVAEFRNYKFIPAQEREVTDRMFQVSLLHHHRSQNTGPLQSDSSESLQKCLQEYETRLKKGEIIDTKEYLDSHRALVAKYLQKVKMTSSVRLEHNGRGVEVFVRPHLLRRSENRLSTDSFSPSITTVCLTWWLKRRFPASGERSRNVCPHQLKLAGCSSATCFILQMLKQSVVYM